MSEDNRDTSNLPPPPPAPSESGEWHAMSDRELMLAILRGQAETALRLDKIEKRLAEGDGDIGELRRNVDILVGVLRQLCLDRGRPDLAERIERDILAPRKNGAGSDEDTNPGH
jgi:hypothetical protein